MKKRKRLYQTICITMPKELVLVMDKVAHEQRRTRSNFITAIVEKSVKEPALTSDIVQ
jgi:metal-responsive CopG/Arc/MetJ family transcriptional regulator